MFSAPHNVRTWMNEVNLESFFCLVLMISRAKGWLLQNVPTACLIFSSPPLNCNRPNAKQERKDSVDSLACKQEILYKQLIPKTRTDMVL